jgi:hypothetical protein
VGGFTLTLRDQLEWKTVVAGCRILREGQQTCSRPEEKGREKVLEAKEPNEEERVEEEEKQPVLGLQLMKLNSASCSDFHSNSFADSITLSVSSTALFPNLTEEFRAPEERTHALADRSGLPSRRRLLFRSIPATTSKGSAIPSGHCPLPQIPCTP